MLFQFQVYNKVKQLYIYIHVIYFFKIFFLCKPLRSIEQSSLCYTIGPYYCCHCLVLVMTPWTVACKAPLSMRFPNQEYRSGLSFSSPGLSLTKGSNPNLLHWQVNSLLLSHQGSSGPYQLPIYIQDCVYVNPNLLVQPSPPYPLVTMSVFSAPVAKFPFCR